MPKRKGATRIADIPLEILAQLNAGTLETATLSETLAVDFAVLMSHAAPEIDKDTLIQLSQVKSITKRMHFAGGILLEKIGTTGFERFASHPSDIVRGWAAYLLVQIPNLSLSERLSNIRALADDSHFAVREWSWLALRPHVSADITNTIHLLTPCTEDLSANIRRFTTEITRPRGVWCDHIPILKQSPQMGLPLLEPLKADTSRYVQDSVANWLNDASKTRPDWVRGVCQRWLEASPTSQTRRICQRGMRNLIDNGCA